LSGFQDIMPTFGDIAGFTPPSDSDGISLVPTLLGKPGEQTEHEFLYWEFLERGGKKGVTTTEWKAIMLDTDKPSPKPLELYDLASDPSETKNVAGEHPELVKKMTKWILESHRN